MDEVLDKFENCQNQVIYFRVTAPLFLKMPIFDLFIPCHMIVAGYYGFALDVRVSACPSVVRPSVYILFPDDNLSRHQWIFTNLVFALKM